MTSNITIDLSDVDMFVRGEHHAALAALRRDSPIYWNEGADDNRFWALTTYADVMWAYRNHTQLSSECGAIVGGSFRNESDTAGGKMLVAMDLPRHRLLKQELHPSLGAATNARVAEVVRDLVDKAVQRTLAAGGCDFATEIATELPAGALMAVMGIGHQEAHHLITLTRRMVGFRDPNLVDIGDEPEVRLAQLQADIFEFFTDLIEERTANRGEDLISHLLDARVNGRPLSDEELYYNCMNVAVGGNETSSYTACTGMLALVQHADQYEKLLAGPALVPRAIDEMLRWSSTNAYVQRVAKTDIARGSITIRKGDFVTLWNVSANRDEDQFPRADTFDITRKDNRHLSYGSGTHRCIGAPIAQTELSLLFDRLVADGIRFELAGQPTPLRSNFILGLTHLPLGVVGT